MKGGNLRSPDIAFTRKDRFPNGVPPEGFGDVAPDLCVEIISPSEQSEEIARKLREYFASGAKQVWHLFPESRRVTVFTSPTEKMVCEADEELTASDLLPCFRCRVGDLFVLEP